MIFGGFLKLSTQVTKTILMVDSADHITGKTGLSAGITKYLTKQDGSAAAATMTTAVIAQRQAPTVRHDPAEHLT